MTASIPLSLQTNPDQFQNWIVPRGSVPRAMPWVEVVDEGAEPFIQASANQPPAAHMTFATPWSNFLDYGADIFLSIIGGYDQGTEKMCAPMAWPFDEEGVNGQFATDVSVASRFLDNSVPWAAGLPAPYRIAVYTVTFQGLPYDVNVSKGGKAYNPNWLEIKSQATNEVFQSPVGYYVFASDTSQIAISGTFYPYQSSYLEVIVHRVPNQTVLTAGGGICSVQQYVGTINSDVIFGCDENSLLFDSLTIAPFGDWQGNNIYDVHLFFNYRPVLWNTGLADNGTWKTIQTNSGGNPPLLTTVFANIINALLPENE